MRDLEISELSSKIQIWIKDYVKNANADKVILGLSGGIDSAVTAALCMKALGNQNVTGLILPCESISTDIADAEMVARNLGIKRYVIDLTPIYEEFLSYMPIEDKFNKLPKANLKVRLRMVTLYYICQILGNCLVAGTGNRAEMAIGYFTKYGDGGVDFEPLGLLYKSEVRALAKILHIPEKIIKKTPSPGLWPGQTDEGEIGLSYDTIDEILYRMDYNLNFDGLDVGNVNKVRKLIRKAAHKLRPPPSYFVQRD
ncbi:MAG: NAD+ synthase [Candidatus Thorarchaeota archaeon]